MKEPNKYDLYRLKNKINNQNTTFYYATELNTLPIFFDTNINNISTKGKIKSDSIVTTENISTKPDTIHKTRSIKRLKQTFLTAKYDNINSIQSRITAKNKNNNTASAANIVKKDNLSNITPSDILYFWESLEAIKIFCSKIDNKNTALEDIIESKIAILQNV